MKAVCPSSSRSSHWLLESFTTVNCWFVYGYRIDRLIVSGEFQMIALEYTQPLLLI